MQELIFYKACPLCRSAFLRELRRGNCSQHRMYKPALSAIMIWLECDACGHVFRNGYYTQEACEILFSDTHVHQKVGHDYERQRLISARIIEKILPYASQGVWLDIGFGNASLLFTAQEYGFTPVGLDLRKDNVESLQQAGIEAHYMDVLELDATERFRVISMADVLEHTAFPIPILRQAHKLLQKDGLLFLSMPNRQSPIWQRLDAQKINPYWGEIEHYHNFTREGLYRLISDQGFEPLRYGISERYRACMEIIARKCA